MILKIFKLPYVIFLFFGLQIGIALMWPVKIIIFFENPIFSTLNISILFIALLIAIILSFKNKKKIWETYSCDKFFLIFFLLAFSLLIYFFFQPPEVIRLDKGVSAIQVAQNKNNIDLTNSPRAEGFSYLISHYNDYFTLTFRDLVALSSFLIFFQSLLAYGIFKLIFNNKKLAFILSLIFLFQPNNFLIANTPDYFFSGQVVGTISLFTLLLFIKYKNKSILVLSLALVVLSLLMRVEMIIWLFIYLVLLYAWTPNDQRRKVNKIIAIFLPIAFFLTFPVILSYTSAAFIGGCFTNPEQAGEIMNNGGYLSGLAKYHIGIVKKNFLFNINFLYQSIPLAWILFLVPFILKKNKDAMLFAFYFFTYFIVITAFSYSANMDVIQYIPYIILPLIILIGICVDKFKIIRNRFSLQIIIAIFFIFFSFKLQESIHVYHKYTREWKEEYSVAESNKTKISKNSVILSNDRSIFIGVFGMNNKDVSVVQVEKNIDEEIDYFKNLSKNIYISQGMLECVYVYRYKEEDEGKEFRDRMLNKYNIDVIYDYSVSRKDWFPNDCAIFLFKLNI